MKLFVHRAEVAAVVGEIAMIAQHEIAMRRHHGLRIRAHVFIDVRHVRLAHAMPVHEHHAVFDLHAVSGDGHHALDVALGGIARIAKDDYIASVR